MARRERAITLIALMRRTSRLMVEEITERMEAAGYPDAPSRHHPVFENVDPEGTRVTVLAARAGITHQAMAQLVAELEERQLVERVADPSDGRARLVRLTEDGRAVVRDAIEQIALIEEKWLRRWRQAGLDGDPRAALEAALREELASRRADVGASD
jgi:DNA-binding MarR family transcriptional regulator